MLKGAGSSILTDVNGLILASLPVDWSANIATISNDGYAGYMINQMVYRQNAIASISLSGTIYQVITFWDKNSKLVIGKRTLDGSWTLYTYNGSGGLPNIALSALDNHNVSTVGLDTSGYIHVCYDMHDEALNYRRSDAAISSWTGGLTNELSMLGTNEDQFTYPVFFSDPSGGLYVIHRNWLIAGYGKDFIYKYDTGGATWSAVTGSGSGGEVITANGSWTPYYATPVFDANFGSGGYMHLFWSWRDSGGGANNHDICYVKWDGTNWKQADGTAQTVPITTANCETALTIATGNNLGSLIGTVAGSDSSGRPYVTYHRKGGDSKMHLYLVGYESGSWVSRQLTTTADSLFIDDDLDYPLSYAHLAIDRYDDTGRLIFRDDAGTAGVLMLTSDPGDFSTWTESVFYGSAGDAQSYPFDLWQWEHRKKLYVLLQPWLVGQSDLDIQLLTAPN